MKHWPVSDSYSKEIPTNGAPGCFWRNRGDRFHCGIDIYAQENSDVVSIETGLVVDVGEFTSPEKVHYWNTTYYVLVEERSGLFLKYAELGDVSVKKGDLLNGGDLIGLVGLVLDVNKISEDSPKYIQDLKEKGNAAMLHLELYDSDPIISHKNYLGGNWFKNEKPHNLIDPSEYLLGRNRHHLDLKI